MFGGLANLFDKEGMVKDTIQSTLTALAEEMGCNWTDFYIVIKPTGEDYEFKFVVFKRDENRKPVEIREISIKEILGDED